MGFFYLFVLIIFICFHHMYAISCSDLYFNYSNKHYIQNSIYKRGSLDLQGKRPVFQIMIYMYHSSISFCLDKCFKNKVSGNCSWLCWCFTALQHFSDRFGRGQLTFPHCSWASLLCSLPVLGAHSFASN